MFFQGKFLKYVFFLWFYGRSIIIDGRVKGFKADLENLSINAMETN